MLCQFQPLGLEVRYKTLVETSRALVKNLAQDAILASVADLIGRIAPFNRIGLMLYEPESCRKQRIRIPY